MNNKRTAELQTYQNIEPSNIETRKWKVYNISSKYTPRMVSIKVANTYFFPEMLLNLFNHDTLHVFDVF